MRKRRAITILLVTGALLLMTVAGVALARTFTCQPGSTKQNPCKGTKKTDLISGTDGKDYILAGRGNDQVNAEGGDDEVHSGRGSDEDIDGGDGDDHLYGERGNDDLDGQQGDDVLYGGIGDDDIHDLSPADEDVVLDGPGNVQINLQDGDGEDTLCTTDGETLDSSDPGDTVIDDQELCALL